MNGQIDSVNLLTNTTTQIRLFITDAMMPRVRNFKVIREKI